METKELTSYPSMSELDKMYPQTKEELEKAKSLLAEELNGRGLSGIPSIDRPWRKYYSKALLDVKPPQMSMSEYLYTCNKERLDYPALRYKGKKITYEELLCRIDDAAKRFQKIGVREGDYVNLALPISPETIYMIYGLDKIGANAALIDPRVNQERMAYYLELVQSKIVGITGVYAQTMRKSIKAKRGVHMLNISPLQTFSFWEQPKLKVLYNLRMLSESVNEKIFNIGSRINKTGNRIISSKRFYSSRIDEKGIEVPQYKENKTAIVEYTSGTTGVPKGLELSAAGANLVARQLIDLIVPSVGETILGIMPPFISYGVVCGMHTALCGGLECILIPNFTPERFASLVIEHKPNHLMCVPAFLQLLMASNLVSDNTDLSFIKNIIIGGNKTGIEFEKDFNEWLYRHGCKTTISKGGGMAEYSACLFFTPYIETRKPGVYGLPLPAVDAKIVDENGKELGYYEIGEIHISSPQQMNGYVNNQAATDAFFYKDKDGRTWGRTGDLGYVDINGLFTLMDRKKHMIIRPDGHNVFPSEISAVINEHDAVKDCLVTGIPDVQTESGVWPTAFIELKDSYLLRSKKVMKEIVKLCESKLPLRDRPRKSDYIQVKKIITTVEGKTDIEATIQQKNRV